MISKKLSFVRYLWILLAIIYIGLLVGVVLLHYQELVAVSDDNIFIAMQQNNWKYWFENSENTQTFFSNIVQILDMKYFGSQGIVLLVVNFVFMFGICVLVSKIAFELMNLTTDNSNKKQTLLFLIITTILFSLLQDGAIVWMFNQQIFAAYFFPLLSYYLFVKYISTNNEKLYYTALFSGILVIFATPYNVAALFVLWVLGFLLKIEWQKQIFLLFLWVLTFLLSVDWEAAKHLLAMFSGIYHYGNIIHYILNYLGSPFIYISFEPCWATSSVLAGLFLFGTFVYMVYLILFKKDIPLTYHTLAAYLMFYIITAFASLESVADDGTLIFQSRFMTSSLIAWALIVIFYLYHFYNKEMVYRRIMILVLTLTAVLYGYQVRTYVQYQKETTSYKLAIEALKFGIYDPHFIRDMLKLSHIVYYDPSDPSAVKKSIFTVHDMRRQMLMKRNKLLQQIKTFPSKNVYGRKDMPTETLKTGKRLRGAIDKITYIDKNKKIAKVIGWVFNPTKKQVPQWLMILNKEYTPVGYILSGLPRQDVANIYGNSVLRSGFVGYIKSDHIPTELYLMDYDAGYIIKAEYDNIVLE